MFTHRYSVTFVLFLSIISWLGTAAGAAQLQVVTTTPIFADLAKNVGGHLAHVQSIVPAHVDPHSFEPTPKEARMFNQADIVIRNGLGLEQWMDKLMFNTQRYDMLVVTLSEGLTPLDTVSYAAHQGHPSGDPHFWLDVTYAMHYVRRIEQAFISTDPENKAVYASLANEYIEKLRELHEWIEDNIQTR